MMNLKNFIFIALLVVLFVEVLIIFPSKLEHKEETVSAPVSEANSNQPEQKMQGVHLVEAQQGRRDWELVSEAAEGRQGKGAWDLKNVKVLFYNQDKVDFTVTGDLGSIDGKSKDIRIKGNVVTKSENGYIFKTSSILYNAKKRQISSPDQVAMIGPKDSMGDGFVVQGKDMKVFVEENKMLINQNVRGQKKFKDGKEFFVSSEKAEFSGKSKQAKFLEKVEMKYGPMRLEGPAAIFQYKGGSDLLSYVQIQGGVKVSDVDKVATAETVNIDIVKNMFTFKGRPKVIQDNDELTGEEIIFLEGGKKVKVEKVRARMENKQ